MYVCTHLSSYKERSLGGQHSVGKRVRLKYETEIWTQKRTRTLHLAPLYSVPCYSVCACVRGFLCFFHISPKSLLHLAPMTLPLSLPFPPLLPTTYPLTTTSHSFELTNNLLHNACRKVLFPRQPCCFFVSLFPSFYFIFFLHLIVFWFCVFFFFDFFPFWFWDLICNIYRIRIYIIHCSNVYPL